jgi:hypothetical protein
MKHFLLIPLLACALAMPYVSASAAEELWVNAETGDDLNAGTEDAPFKTLGAAVEAAEETGTITVARGTYEEPTTVVIDKSIGIFGDGRGVTLISATGEVLIDVTETGSLTLSNIALEGNGTNTGIRTSGSEATVDGSAFTDFATAIEVNGGNLTSVSNVFEENGTSIKVAEGASSYAEYNSFSEEGIAISAAGEVVAERNWWGHVSGPDTATNSEGKGAAIHEAAAGLVTYLPWHTNSDGTMEITVLTLTANDDGTYAGTLDGSFYETSEDGEAIVDIDAGTVIMASSTWNGILLPPYVTEVALSIPGYSASVGLAVEVGPKATQLTLSNPARIMLEGQADMRAGWMRDGAFTEITAVCEENPDENAMYLEEYLIPTGATDCVTEIPGENDLYIWTRHFTTFLSFEATALPEPEPEPEEEVESGGGGGGSSRGGSGRSGQKKVEFEEEEAPLGFVLGTSAYNFATDLEPGMQNADVTALQEWLASRGYAIPSGATGYYGAETAAAVTAFQRASGISPANGRFGPLTRAAVTAAGGTLPEEARLLLLQELLAKLQQLQAALEELER